MPRTRPFKANQFTVVGQWQPKADVRAPWQTFVVILSVFGGAQNAANEACLFVLWKHMGQAMAAVVLEGEHVFIPDRGMFDAEEYDDTVTFGARIKKFTLFG